MTYAPALTQRFAVIAAVFHREVTERMIASALELLRAEGCTALDEDVIRVPGAMELPLTVKRQLTRDEIDGAVALGIIERGGTAHGRVMADAVIPTLIALQLETMKPLGTGILGPEILPDQIEPRAVPYAEAAARALLHQSGVKEGI